MLLLDGEMAGCNAAEVTEGQSAGRRSPKGCGRDAGHETEADQDRKTKKMVIILGNEDDDKKLEKRCFSEIVTMVSEKIETKQDKETLSKETKE